MMNNLTRHATRRASRRGIPPLIVEWLFVYGEEKHDGHGAVIRFFGHDSVRRLERDVGRQLVGQLGKYLKTYVVEGTDDGSVITLGWRNRRVKR